MMEKNLNEVQFVEEIIPKITNVVIDGLAVLKIIKHCHDNLPTMVAGSLLGIDVDGTLEITYTYSFPVPKNEVDINGDLIEDIDGPSYQIEMMKMLRDVNIDNNCVGWYQSMYLGTIYTNDVVEYQYNYQSSEELSENCIVIMYDPILSRKGNLVLKAFRLSEEYLELRRRKINYFIEPSKILEELPLKIRNSGHIAGFIRCLQDSHSEELHCDLEALSLSNSDFYIEKHLDLLNTWLDDLVQEQQRFQQYSRSVAKIRQQHIQWLIQRIQENKELRMDGEKEQSYNLEESKLNPLPPAPPRLDALLQVGQIEKFCEQLNDTVDSNLQKLYLTSQVLTSSTTPL